MSDGGDRGDGGQSSPRAAINPCPVIPALPRGDLIPDPSDESDGSDASDEALTHPS